MSTTRSLVVFLSVVVFLTACGSSRVDPPTASTPPVRIVVSFSTDEPVAIELLQGTVSADTPVSVLITRPPRFGRLENHGDGTVTYFPAETPPDQQGDDFAYVLAVNGDDYGAPAEVTLLREDLVTAPSQTATRNSGEGPTPTESPLPQLSVSPAGFDFGEQCVNDCPSSLTLELTSTGGQALEIIDDSIAIAQQAAAFTLVGTCVGAVLKNGESCRLELVFLATTTGSHELDLSIRHNGSESPLTVSFRGTGLVPQLIASVESHDFGQVCVWDCSREVTIEFSAGGPLDVVLGTGITEEFIGSAYEASSGCVGVRLRGGSADSCSMTLVFSPQSPGEHTVDWEIDYVGAAASLSVRIRGLGACVEPIPTELLDLLSHRIGYGRNATGGADGCLYRVTNDAERGPGSLREGAERGGAWIVFDLDFDIWVKYGISIGPNTTIDGRGTDITIIGGSGTLQVHERNVIIASIETDSPRAATTTDGIEINGPRATDIWLDHISFLVAPDELLSIWVNRNSGGAPGDITISWSRFGEGGLAPRSNQTGSHAILIGAQAEDGFSAARTHMTLAFNLFATHSRAPLIGDGARVHIMNNLYADWQLYGFGVRLNGLVRSENNVFAKTKGSLDSAFSTRGDQRGEEVIYDEGSWFPGGATGLEHDRERVFTPDYPYLLLPANAALVDLIEASSGP